MKREKISETIENINPKYIDEATEYTGVAKITPKKVWYKWAAVAACFALVLAIGLGQFTRNYTQTVKRAADNKRRYAPGKGSIPPFVVWGFQRGSPFGTRLCKAKCSVLYALSALP